ncbi:MAG TPA: Maf family protein [Gemmatimonadales bacterium]|nr:Maf family protein [Gemmatimonadales bacterium]
MSQPALVLASASPRRRQLLEMLGIPVTVRPSQVPEVRLPGEMPVPYAERLARAKALGVEGDLVLGADTLVVVGGDVLEKPTDEADALRMLKRLQGRTHEVVTSVALSARRNTRVLTDRTRVTFRAASDDTLRDYIATGEPMDKAGAYGIQGYGAALVEKIDGDFFGVMGLPVRLVLELLRHEGVEYRFGQ